MVETFYRIRCTGPCDRWLSDITPADRPSMTSRAGTALVYYQSEDAERDQERYLPNGRCPKCT